MKPNIGISAQHLAEESQVLSHVLADEFVLYTKTRNAHWNVEGPDFHTMHVLFESQYNELAEVVDKSTNRPFDGTITGHRHQRLFNRFD